MYIIETSNHCYSILNTGGMIAVCDVGSQSNQDRFLNTFVDQTTTTGHEGIFFAKGEFSERLRDAGFTEIKETNQEYKWRFESLPKMLQFVKNLFALENVSSIMQVHNALKEYQLSPTVTFVDSHFDWALRLASGVKGTEVMKPIQGASLSQISTHLIEQESHIVDSFSDFVRVLRMNGWEISHEGLQGRSVSNSDTFRTDALKMGENGKNLLSLFVLVISVEEDVVYVWDNNIDHIELPENFKLQTTSPDVRSFALQEWTVDKTHHKLLQVSPVTKTSQVEQHVLLQQMQLLSQTDLGCTMQNENQVACTFPSSVAQWKLIEIQ